MQPNAFESLARILVDSQCEVGGGARLLSLDGGGIRGLSSLVVLERIMRAVKDVLVEKGIEPQQKLPKPCDYFDLIGGTSTGGIIALMLGPLKMQVEDAIDCYKEFSREVFGTKKWGFSDGKYKSTKLKSAIEGTVAKFGDGQTMLRNDGTKTYGSSVLHNHTSAEFTPFHPSCPVCSFVCARNGDQNRLVLMCSYEVEEASQPRRFHDPGDKTGLKIWQAALATSAAPSFFKPVKLNGISFIDGGLGYNNPAFEVLDEGEDLFDFSVPGPGNNAKGLACLVSIGTGEAKVVSAYNWQRSLRQRVVPVQTIRAMIAIVTDCDSTHERLTRRFRSCPHKYFRFNVEEGLEDIGLDHWKKLDEVERATKGYLTGLERE
ncbi:hypothetical protein CVT26_001588 [Gymnopilus dilepis]|uniref:PNPLA domain-containing protein n=1 Tax=Gymnopilus dilepis TaxID=231916 RepID=A0A409VTI3_9AGAR|nr:hypothetical protein CVT26_001588 [Gymnopilus dilepis]